DFELAPKQRQQARTDARLLNRGERLIAEPWRIAETRGAELERNPRKHGELEIAGEREIAPGLALDEPLDVVPIVVRVDEDEHEHERDDDQGDQSADDKTSNLQCAHRDSSQATVGGCSCCP